MSVLVQNSVNQPRVIQNGIARFDIAQQIDERNLVSLRTRQRAHDEIEIGCGKPCPTIRPDHRDFIMRDPRPCGKQDCNGILSVSGERKTQKEAQKEEAKSFPLKMPRSCWSGQYRTWDDS